MAERLVRELRTPYLIDGRQVVVTVSIGIASAREAGETASDVTRNADLAMYMAKANGKAGFAIFDPGMHALIRERHELAAQLLNAVDLGQLRVMYQPIVSLATGVTEGVEALVRWDHPERGLVAPGDFIEIAEENGAILPIGRWVLGEACRQARDWGTGPRCAVPVRQRLGAGDPAARLRRVGRADTGRGRIRAPTAPPRDHRDGAPSRDACDHPDVGVAAVARGPDRDRRLRDRLFLPEPSPPVPGGCPEDRERVRAGRVQ